MLCSAQMESRASARVLLLALALVASPLIAAASDEAVALLAFKRSSVEVDPRNSLQSWGEGGSGDPCSWYGVTCSGTDWRVRGLDLRNLGLVGRLRMDDLMSLQGLGDVNLRGNSFYGNLSHAVAAPCAFEVVDLSGNNFSEAVASRFLGSCNNLVSLNLSRNSIPGGIHPFPPSLRTLDLSRNSISDDGLLNYSLAGGCSRGLSYLNMSGNKLSGSLQEGVSAACGDLAVLDLSYNLFSSGEIPRGFFMVASSLRQLSLSHNNFSGDFYSIFQFGPCGNLTGLDLSHNSLRGSGLPPTLDNCRQLESLDLSHNAFEGAIPAFLGNMRSLKHLSLSNNNFSGELTPELSELCGTLVELDLSGNMLTGGLPPAFTSCAALQVLHLGDNQLSGDFISTVVRALPKLRFLYLPFNNITGPLPLQSLRNCTSLEVIDLGSNEFTGSIPRGLCSWLPSLQKLLLPSNFLSGALPPELGDCTDLRALDLSFNDLSGPIPPEILSLPNLVDLVMWANKLSGEISDELCSNGVFSLQTLILNHNVITGIIPPSLTRCTNLIWVSLSGNKLSGSIPDDIGNLQNLAILQLGNNTLSGAIPPSLGACRNLIWLDLTLNDLSGPIPSTLASQTGLIAPGAVSGKQFAFLRNEGGSSCAGAGVIFEFAGIRPERLAAFPLVHACPTTRIYTGTAVYTFAGNGSMIYLDLSYNSLSGGIPDNMGAMNYLQVFNLGHNQLTGPIPVTFGGLKAVGVLDLSHNLLTGDIPGSLGTLSFLVDLDVSNNHLSGTIPSAGQLTTFPASRYDNNSAGLCGVPLPPCRYSGAGSGLLPNTSKSGDYLRRFLGGSMLIGIAISVLIILALGVTLYRLRKKEEEAAEEIRAAGYVDSLPTTSGTTSWKFPGVLEPLSINVATFEKPLRKLTFAHLLEATNGFSADSLIGSGGFGEVYKARLKDGCTVAIKKLVHVTGQGDREFTAEMETIGKIKHRNLVPLLGYCKVGEERLLVYEYMKHGSLDMVLHDGRPPSKGGGGPKLDWPARKRIAIGSARGLAFLHHSCIPHIIHRDMKSSNVLLDENLEPRVSDFGMARLMNALDTHLSVSTLAGTPGYVPPEYYQSFRCTTKGDVYSYGVLLLELLSGKRPTDQTEFGDNNNLVGWAKQMVRENRSSEIFDPELTGSSKSGEAELYRYLKIACECLEDRPLRRPTMIQVMAMFKELQTDSDSDILDGLSSLLDTTVINESREKIP